VTTLFTSDLHFGHLNVIKYCSRPFSTGEEMNETLIRNWNRAVSPSDTVYVIGDFALCRSTEAITIARRLNGTKVLVAGNHDHAARKKYASGAGGGPFQAVYDLKEIQVDGQRIVMCHYPLMTWNKAHYGSWMLHGHCHGSLPEDPHSKRLDVGVDTHEFRPWTFTEVHAKMSSKTFRPVDHHTEEVE